MIEQLASPRFASHARGCVPKSQGHLLDDVAECGWMQRPHSGRDVLSHKDHRRHHPGDDQIDGAQNQRVGESVWGEAARRNGLEELTGQPGRRVGRDSVSRLPR